MSCKLERALSGRPFRGTGSSDQRPSRLAAACR
jgi:hypothetical protein